MPSPKLSYKVSCDPAVLYAIKNEAIDAAEAACRARGEPVLLLGVRADGAVREWVVVSTQEQFELYNQKKNGLIMIVDPPKPEWFRTAKSRYRHGVQ